MTSARHQMLLEAAATTEERGESYGPPADHFRRTTEAIHAIFGLAITPAQWGQMMIIDKLARHQCVSKTDNLLDVAGYAACVHEIDSAPDRSVSKQSYLSARDWESAQVREQLDGLTIRVDDNELE